MNNPDPSRLLTISEAARLIHVHPNTLRNWEKAGRISALRVGPRRDRRYAKESLKQLLAGPSLTQAEFSAANFTPTSATW